MSQKGILPKRLLECTKPFCAGCQYGKLTRKPWQSKGAPTTPIQKATSSSQIISVDQLESSMVGFIAQLKGKLTTQRYQYATMFMDQHSRYTYVYLQRAITSAETVQAKHSFECLAEDMGIRVHHYHAENGWFTDTGFVEDCQKQCQGITYCGVNAHFQNGIAEKKIHDLQEQTRTMMLHALCKWSSMLSIHLWPYGLRMANDICNSTPHKGSDISPIELFSGVTMHQKLKHYHSFGCPTYILDKALQAQKSLPKWQSRAKLGMYLGPSPNHSCSVSLMLNPCTGHVSPQFHVKHDEFFKTVDGRHRNYDAPAATWKELSGLTSTQHKDAVPSTIRPLREHVGSPASTMNHTSQEDPHVSPPEPTEDMNLIKEMPTATAPQEESAASTDHHMEQRQTQNGRVVHNTTHYSEGLEQREQGIVAWEVLISQDETEDIPTAQRQYEIQKSMQEPMVYMASVNPDIM